MFAGVVRNLVAAPKPEEGEEPDPDADVVVDEKFRVVSPTERGIDSVEAMLQR